MDGASMAAVLALGAQAAQRGTAFLVTPESAADAADRAALLYPRSRTALTRAISGRLARSIENAFTDIGRDPDCPPIPDYPIAFGAPSAQCRGEGPWQFRFRRTVGRRGGSIVSSDARSRTGRDAHAGNR
jgi:NAD(P)H-dependent flavin oxidoreductase YrpB (nitropropane dioxygenase family)